MASWMFLLAVLPLTFAAVTQLGDSSTSTTIIPIPEPSSTNQTLKVTPATVNNQQNTSSTHLEFRTKRQANRKRQFGGFGGGYGGMGGGFGGMGMGGMGGMGGFGGPTVIDTVEVTDVIGGGGFGGGFGGFGGMGGMGGFGGPTVIDTVEVTDVIGGGGFGGGGFGGMGGDYFG